jgi:hypothetical protein
MLFWSRPIQFPFAARYAGAAMKKPASLGWL